METCKELEGVERIEQQVRCFSCDKFLTKTITTIYFNPSVLIHKAINLRELFSRLELQIRFGTETKCPRCKSLDAKVIYAV